MAHMEARRLIGTTSAVDRRPVIALITLHHRRAMLLVPVVQEAQVVPVAQVARVVGLVVGTTKTVNPGNLSFRSGIRKQVRS